MIAARRGRAVSGEDRRREGPAQRGHLRRHGPPQNRFELVGQTEAVTELEAPDLSARLRDARLDHTLLASGLYGIRKDVPRQAHHPGAGAGLVEASG